MSKIELSQDTIKLLKHLSEINQSLRIVPGQPLRSMTAKGKSFMVVADVAEEIPRTMNIYDLREFIQAVSLFHKPIVDFSSDKFVTIEDADGYSKMRYQDANEELVQSPQKDVDMPPCEIEIDLAEDDLKNVMTAASVLKLPYVGFKSDGENVFFTAFNITDGDENETNNYVIKVGEGDGTPYSMYVKSNTMLMLEGDYDVVISSKKIARWKHKTSDLTYFMGMEGDSTYGE